MFGKEEGKHKSRKTQAITQIAPSDDRAVNRDPRSRSRSRLLREIAIDGAISPSRDRTGSRSRSTARTREDRDLAVDRDLAIAPLIAILDRDRRRGCRTVFSVVVDFFLRCGLCFSLHLCFPSSFPNTRKYFPENFLKCNQTPWKHFPFPENVLRQPNTALITK